MRISYSKELNLALIMHTEAETVLIPLYFPFLLLKISYFERGDFEVAQANPCLFSGLPTYLVCSLMLAFDVMSAFGVPF